MFTKISKEDILLFLRSVAIMSIAAVDEDKPISSVVVFVVDNDLSFYFFTKKETYKAKALLKNPKISLSVWENNRMLVQASGNTREVESGSEFNEVLGRIKKAPEHLKNFWWPILSINKGEFIVFKVSTEWLRVLDLTGKNIKEEGDPFYTIDLSSN